MKIKYHMPSMFIKVFVIFCSTFDRKIDLSTLFGLGHGDIKPMKGQNANGICSKI